MQSLINWRIKVIQRLQISICNYTNEIPKRKEPNYVFREVRNNSIIRDFAFGLVNPQLLKIPDGLQSDSIVTNLTSQLDNIPTHTSPSSFLEQLKKLGIFGAILPSKYGGLGLKLTNYTNLIQHSKLIDWVLPLVVQQNLCAQTILLYGSEEQKLRYLPKLASGESIGAFCLTENSSGSDMAAMETEAVLNAIEDHYLIHGTKNWVMNGAVADLMIVFALTRDSRHEGGRENLTALIVDRGEIEGVTVTNQYNIECLPNCHLADVSFESASVPVTNVLFEDHAGYKIANHIQNNARCLASACIIGLLRILIDDLVDKDRKGVLGNNEHVRQLVDECVSYLYAMESSLFFTTRFADQYEVAEIELESAALKVFSSEKAKIVVDNYIRILAIVGNDINPEMARLCDRVSYLQSFLGSNYFVRLYIGGTMSALSEFTFREINERMKSPVENFEFMSGLFKNIFRPIQWTEKVKESKYQHIVDRTVFKKELQLLYRKLHVTRVALHRALRQKTEADVPHQNIMEALSHVGILVYIVSCCVARANTTYGDFEIACTEKILEQAKYVLNYNIQTLTHVATYGKMPLLQPLFDDIIAANGYPSDNFFEIVTNAKDQSDTVRSKI